jgi:hypothetical protein
VSAYPEYLRAQARAQVMAKREERARARDEESETSSLVDEHRVREAIQSSYHWTMYHTKTLNPHWKEEGLPGPEEPFPRDEYFRPLFELFDFLPVIPLRKSRDMMASWAIMAYFTHQTMTVPGRMTIVQTLKEKKVKELVGYAKQLYKSQPAFLKEAFPLARELDTFAATEFEWANGSRILGIPAGIDQLRLYHPWGYFLDEASFIPDAGACYDNSISAVQKIVLNSSAGVSWYSGFCNDEVL